jgi:ParB/RepB/Spo0J family partition protein
MTGKYLLKEISPNDVAFNKDNPRGESAEEIRMDRSFEQLKDSVAQFGVLVPVVVHAGEEGGKPYRLVDGERRLRAALATNLDTIPAHIARSSDPMGEKVQAFHIHMLRKQWRPVAIVRAFKTIRKELKKSKGLKSDKELLKELQVLTGCTSKQLEELERGIHYPEQVLKEIDDKKLKWSHLVQFEASFVEQLEQHYPSLLKELGARKVREVLTEKARNRVIGTTRDLIEYMVPIFQRAKKPKERKAAEKLFERFVGDAHLSPESIKLDYDRQFPPPQDQLDLANDIIKECDKLTPMIEQVESGLIISYNKRAKELKKKLDALKQTAAKKIRQLNKVME